VCDDVQPVELARRVQVGEQAVILDEREQQVLRVGRVDLGSEVAWV
jgi:hypothetical protein